MRNFCAIVLIVALWTACSSTKKGGVSIKSLSQEKIETDTVFRKESVEAIPTNNAPRKWEGDTLAVHAANIEALDRAIKIVLKEYRDEDLDFLLAVSRYIKLSPRGKLIVDKKTLARDLEAHAFLTSYEAGYLSGLKEAEDNFTTGISVSKTEYIHKPHHYLPFLLNFDTVAATICQKDEPVMSQESFALASGAVIAHSLFYLCRNLLHTGLAWDRMTDATQFFEAAITPRVSEVLFGVYLEEMKKTMDSQPDGPFYNYDYYRSTETFISLMTAWMAGIADYALSYGTGSSEFAATNSFFMQEVGELLIEHIAPEFQDILYKNSLLYHYDMTVDTLRALAITLTDSILVETRQKTRNVNKKFGGGGLSARTSADLKAIINVGVLADSIKIELDHKNREWVITLPDDPKMLGVVHYDHKIAGGITYTFECECDFKDIGTRETVAAGVALPENGDLTSLLNKKIPFEKIRNMDFAKRRLDASKVKEIIEPILIKIFEPVVGIPHSCYSVVLKFGNNPKKTLIKAPCNLF